MKQIKEYQKEYDFEMLAYAIMDNRYHLIVRILKSSISKIMNIKENEQDRKSDFELIEKMFKIESNNLTTIPKERCINLSKRESLDDIFLSVFATNEIQNLIKSKIKNRNLTPLKLEFINRGIYNKYSLKEILSFLNSTKSAISKFLLRHNISI